MVMVMVVVVVLVMMVMVIVMMVMVAARRAQKSPTRLGISPAELGGLLCCRGHSGAQRRRPRSLQSSPSSSCIDGAGATADGVGAGPGATAGAGASATVDGVRALAPCPRAISDQAVRAKRDRARALLEPRRSYQRRVTQVAAGRGTAFGKIRKLLVFQNLLCPFPQKR